MYGSTDGNSETMKGCECLGSGRRDLVGETSVGLLMLGRFLVESMAVPIRRLRSRCMCE